MVRVDQISGDIFHLLLRRAINRLHFTGKHRVVCAEDHHFLKFTDGGLQCPGDEGDVAPVVPSAIF
jgi:hypothetical protein